MGKCLDEQYENAIQLEYLYKITALEKIIMSKGVI